MQRGVLILAAILGLGAIAALASRPASPSPAPSGSAAATPAPAGALAPAPAGEPLFGPVSPVNPNTSLSGPGDWVMEGSNPARTRETPAKLALPLTQIRELGVASQDENGSPPVIAAGLLLTETSDHLRAFDIATGQQRWIYSERGSYISPAVAGERVYMRAESNNQGSVIALSLQTGEKLWEFTPRRLSSEGNSYYGGHLSSPVIVDGVVFVGAGKELYALDAATGALRWEFAAQDYVTSSATVADGQVYISDFRYFYAVDQAKGTLRWAVPIDTNFTFSSVVTGATVLATNGAKLIALDTATGQQRWEFAVANQNLIPAAADGQRAYVKSTSALYALDLASGKQLWSYSDVNYVSLPVLTGGQVFVVNGMGADTKVAVLDAASGASAWSQPVKKLSATAPVIAGRTIYVRTTDGRILALSS